MATSRKPSNRPPKVTAEQATTPVSGADQLSDIERQELATAAATAETTSKDGETARVHTFEPDAYKRWSRRENGLHLVAKHLWDMIARRKGSPLSVTDTERVVRVDPNLGRATCGFLGHGREFVAYQVAFILTKPGQEGNLMTRDKYVTKDNPEGVVYMGSVVRVKDENDHVVPLVCCPEHVETARNAVEQATARRDKDGKIIERGFRPPAQSMDQALLDVEGITANAQRKRDECERALETYGGRRGNFNNPHKASAGRQGRDPRERNISNRGQSHGA